MVDLDISAYRAPHVGDVAALARRDERCSAEPIPDRQIRPGRQQHLEHVDAAGHPGDQPWRVVLVIQRIRVCAQIDQQPGDREPVLGDGEQQRRTSRSSRVSRFAPARMASAAAVASPRPAAASRRRLASCFDGLSASSAARSTSAISP